MYGSPMVSGAAASITFLFPITASNWHSWTIDFRHVEMSFGWTSVMIHGLRKAAFSSQNQFALHQDQHDAVFITDFSSSLTYAFGANSKPPLNSFPI